METHEQRFAAYEASLREKYSDKDREKMAKQGHALPDGSYPIGDSDDLDNAIHAVGRGGADHDTIRKHIIDNAKRLGLSKQIPDNWNADGSMKDEKSDEPDTEQRAQCPTCDGTGKIMDGNRDCPDCSGTGVRSATPLAKTRRKRDRHRAVAVMPEVRFYNGTAVEVRENRDTNEIVITGSPIVYDTPYKVTDLFGEFEERMRPGVVADILKRGADCRFLFNHDGLPLARTTAGTMKLEDTPTALRMTATLDSRQQLSNDLMIAIERGDVAEMSCGFIVARDEWDDAMEHREIIALRDLLDVSAVTYPASPTTSVEVAHRMAMAMPIQSAARARQFFMNARAGKTMSAGNQEKVLGALHTLHGALSDAGADLSPFTPTADEPDGDESPGVERMDDGTVGGSAQGAYGGEPGYSDGTGSRDQADDDVETAVIAPTRSVRALRLQLELAKRRRIAA